MLQMPEIAGASESRSSGPTPTTSGDGEPLRGVVRSPNVRALTAILPTFDEEGSVGLVVEGLLALGVAEVLVERCGRLAHGYRQRENLERSNFYERKRKRFVVEVDKLDVSDPLFAGRKTTRRRLTEAAT